MLVNIKSISIFSTPKSREKNSSPRNGREYKKFFYFLPQKTAVKMKSSFFSLPEQQSWK